MINQRCKENLDHRYNVLRAVFQLIDPAASSVQLMGSKVEVKLKKAEAMSWNVLSVPRAEAVTSTDPSVTKADTEAVTQRVDAVDLSDL